MTILVLGGTRFFGIPMVNALCKKGHEVTIATRGLSNDPYGTWVNRIVLNRNEKDSMCQALQGKYFDLVIDKIAYCSNDIKYALDYVRCGKYIQMSSTAVYEPLHWDTREEAFDGNKIPLVWCNRNDVPYGEGKRQAEGAICQNYSQQSYIAVRYPVVLGTDDYTNRLAFYVEHIIKEMPMFINNMNVKMSFIESKEAGKFIAFLTETAYEGPINGCSNGTISLSEILAYVEKKTNKKAILSDSGDAAPYNDTPDFSINTDRSRELGYEFSNIHDWIYQLLDSYIKRIGKG